jgi:hypothetical protein
MKYLCTLIIFSIAYLGLFQYYPERFETKYHYYFAGFIIINLIFLYLFIYEKQFIYKLFYNVYYSSKHPPIQQNTHNNVDQNQLLKSQISNHQGNQCFKCHNPVFSQDLYLYKLQYIKPLQNGGQNDMNNLQLICPSCYSFL